MWRFVFWAELAAALLCSANVYIRSPRSFNLFRIADQNDLFNSQNHATNPRFDDELSVLEYYSSDDSSDSVLYTKIDLPGIHWSLAEASLLIQYRCGPNLADFNPESVNYAKACQIRSRTLGLYTADQKLGVNSFGYSSSMFTRQNPNGDRFGNECSEERDYYPYWRPSPWIDSVYLTNRIEKCEHIRKQANTPKFECVPRDNNLFTRRWNSKLTCHNNGGDWVRVFNYDELIKEVKSEASCRFQWGLTIDSRNSSDFYCFKNVQTQLRCDYLSLESNRINLDWIIPRFSQDQKCQIRVRLNVSSGDYDAQNINSTFNHRSGIYPSPILTDPNVTLDFGGHRKSSIPINMKTSRVGSVFEDRTHVFVVRKRVAECLRRVKIHHVNHAGDEIVPEEVKLGLKNDDILHFQWNQYPIRYNLMEIDEHHRFVPFAESKFWDSTKFPCESSSRKAVDVAFSFATGGQYQYLNDYMQRKSGIRNFVLNGTLVRCGKKGNYILAASSTKNRIAKFVMRCV